MKICLVFEGGLGQNLIATSVLRQFREKNKGAEINIIASWPEVFKNNKNCNRIASIHDKPYDSFIKDANIYVKKSLYQELTADFKNEHIVKTFNWMHALEYDGLGLDYFPTKEEELKATRFYKSFKSNKPKILLQPYSVGGDKSWIHEYVQELINKTCDKYQWIYINSDLKNFPYNCFNLINVPNRDLFPLVKHCDGLISVDSCLQHMAGGVLKKKSLLLLGRSKKELYAWEDTKVLEVPASCENFGCGRPFPFDNETCLNHACMYAITPDMVIENIEGILCK